MLFVSDISDFSEADAVEYDLVQSLNSHWEVGSVKVRRFMWRYSVIFMTSLS